MYNCTWELDVQKVFPFFVEMFPFERNFVSKKGKQINVWLLYTSIIAE